MTGNTYLNLAQRGFQLAHVRREGSLSSSLACHLFSAVTRPHSLRRRTWDGSITLTPKAFRASPGHAAHAWMRTSHPSASMNHLSLSIWYDSRGGGGMFRRQLARTRLAVPMQDSYTAACSRPKRKYVGSWDLRDPHPFEGRTSCRRSMYTQMI
ncbi:hypothetical protein CC78DRAFT_109984 [Lojkania enalia]|uniref:Uncharacterized protein n=1 Tax=Lojkania enalia TaxID=147567 RepID=A0A9P4KFR4_9PLEO|nr:hypothetical protein CC78DRAFT_109984 [Didymosphaeria enalia]